MALLTVILSTTGRETFYYSLLSVKDQLRPMDEIVVVSAGLQPRSRQIYLNTFGIRANSSYAEAVQGTHPFALGTKLAGGVWLVYMDDRSFLTHGALDVVRDAARDQERFDIPSPLMFKIKYGDGITIDNTFVPYNQRLLWSQEFRKETIAVQGEPITHDDVIQWVPYTQV